MALSGIAQFAINQLLPDGQTERLIFRRFNGAALAKAAETNGTISASDVTTVGLQINPQEIAYDNQKIINKLPTNAPGRFVVFDWGHDLSVMQIRGMTGNLLPTAITNGFDPAKGFIDDVINKLDPTNQSTPGVGAYKGAMGTVSAYGQKILLGGLGYFGVLNMSPKYRTFRRLKEEIYDMFDADQDVLTLEMGDYVYRGYLINFRFTVVQNSPWNWSYDMGFVIMNDLSQMVSKNDEYFNESYVSMVE